MAGAIASDGKKNKQLSAKILLRSKYLSDWTASSYVLGSGEVGICAVPADTSLGETQPTYLMKVGDGTRTWNDLPYVTALAGDVYTWAKAATKPTYTADEIGNLSNYVNARIPTDVIKYSEQTLTNDQKTQARTNIGITDEQISSWDASVPTFTIQFTAKSGSDEVETTTVFNDLLTAITNGDRVIAKFASGSSSYTLQLATHVNSAFGVSVMFSGMTTTYSSTTKNPATTLISIYTTNTGRTWTYYKVKGTNEYDVQTLENTGVKNPNALTVTMADGEVVYDGSAAKSLAIPSVPTDILKYTAQTLTDTQKTQARTNIGITDANIATWNSATRTFIAEFSQPDTSTEVNMSTSLTDLKNAINNGYQVFAKFTRRGTTYTLPLAVYMVASSATRIAFSGAVNMAPSENAYPVTTIMTIISSDGGSTWEWWNVRGTNKYDIQSLEESGVKCPNALTIKLGDTTITYDGSAPQTVTISNANGVSF